MDRHDSCLDASSHRRHRHGVAAVGMAIAAIGLSLGHAGAQHVDVSGGAVQSNAIPATYDSLTVSGTGAGGGRSTYNADAPLTVKGSVQVYDSGIVNANARIDVAGSFLVSGDGLVTLTSGTLTAGTLGLSGPTAVNQAGGNYSTGNLALTGTASLTYGAGDDLDGAVNLSDGSTLTLARSLTLGNYLRLNGGATVSRTTQTITALGFQVYDAQLSLIGGDSFDNAGVSDVFNGAIVDVAAGTTLGGVYVTGTNASGTSARLDVNGNVTASAFVQAVAGGVVNLASGTLTSTSLDLSGSGAVIQGGGHYAVTWLSLSTGAGLTYGPDDSVAMGVSVYDGATFTLARDLSLGGALAVSGPAGFVRAGHDFAVGALQLYDHAAVTFGPADAISESVLVSGTSVLTLGTNLTLTGGLSVAEGGSLLRTTETITAPSFYVSDASLSLLATDAFESTGYSSIFQGGVVNAPAGSSFGFVSVYGTNAADAPATLNVNGNVTAVLGVSAFGGGVVNLASGTLVSQALYLSDAGAAVQGGGHYAVDSLSLANGATLTYLAGDSVTQGVSVYDGATFTLDRDLSLPGYLSLSGSNAFAPAGHDFSVNDLYLNDHALVTYGADDSITNSVSVSGTSVLTLDRNLVLAGQVVLFAAGSIARTTETITAPGFYVNDAALSLLATDTFSPTGTGQIYSGGVVDAPAGSSFGYLYVYGKNAADAPSTLNVNGDVTAHGYVGVDFGAVVQLNTGTLSTPSLSLSGGGAAVQAGGHYAVDSLAVANGAALTYGAGDDVTQQVSVFGGGTFTLARDLSLAGSLSLVGPSAFAPAGHHFTVSHLTVGDHAAVTYGPGDTVTQSLTVSGTGALTLTRDVALSAGVTLNAGGSIVRTTETIAAQSFSVIDSTLALLTGDTFSPTAWSSVMNGGVVQTTAGSTFGNVSITGTNAAGAAAVLTIDGDTSAGTIQAYGSGVVDLVSGTLAAQALLLTGTDSVLRSGGSYDVDQLALAGGAALTYGVGDAIYNLSIDGAGSLLDSFEPLSLMALSVTNGGLLRLNTFTGTGAVPNWGLRLAGDTVSYVQSLIAGNLLSGGSTPLAVFFDSGSNFTFVTPSSTPIPEIDPAAAGGAWTLLVGALGILERRKRRA